jgi:hypothetical protein
MATRRRHILLWSLVVALPGCALSEVHIKAPESGLKAPIPGGNQRQVIVAVPFSDTRQIKDRCGVQKGGYGNETATAVCQGDPARWIAELLAGELRASGFTVLPAEEGARDTALRVEGALLKIFAEPVVGFWSTNVETDLSVKLVATSKTGLRAERTFFVKGEKESVIWPQGIFNDSVADGSRALLDQMVKAILELMKRYPELGLERPLPSSRLSWQMERVPR